MSIILLFSLWRVNITVYALYMFFPLTNWLSLRLTLSHKPFQNCVISIQNGLDIQSTSTLTNLHDPLRSLLLFLLLVMLFVSMIPYGHGRGVLIGEFKCANMRRRCVYSRTYSDRHEKCWNVEEGIRHLSLSLMLICASALQMSHPISRKNLTSPA